MASSQPQLPATLSFRRRMIRWLFIVTIATLPLYLFQIPGWISDWGWNLARVDGRVLLEGEPVVGAKVLFVPISRDVFTGNLSPVSVGRTDPQGRFELKTTTGGTGAVSGRHLVFITTKEQTDAGVVQRLEAIPAQYNTQSSATVDVPPLLGIRNLKFDLKLKQPSS